MLQIMLPAFIDNKAQGSNQDQHLCTGDKCFRQYDYKLITAVPVNDVATLSQLNPYATNFLQSQVFCWMTEVVIDIS